MATPPSNQLDYATPPKRKSRWGVWVFLVLLLLGGVAFLFVGSTSRVTVTIGPVAPVTPAVTVSQVVLPSDPMTITLIQRRSMELPGGAGTPYLMVGDITGGQTIVSLTQSTGPVLFSRSMKEGDTAKVSFSGQTLYVKLTKLQNFAFGRDDQATFELSSKQLLTEAEKIDALIAYVKSLDGATFIRNGTNHTPDEAAAHLQRKREAAGDRIKTATDFIDGVGSGSSVSGDAYAIKLKDGTIHPSADVLKKKLKEIEAAEQGK